MRKGSLTVFFAMIIASVMTLIFTMAECIRLYELHDFGQEFTDIAVESAFSEYNPYLWKNYRILAVDMGYGTDNLGPSIMEQKTMDYCSVNANVDSGNNFARLKPDNCNVDKYSVLTDSNCQGVVMLGVKAAKDGMAQQIIDGIQGNVDIIHSVEKVNVEQIIEDGDKALTEEIEALEEKKAAALNDDDPNTNPEDYPEPGQVQDNPIDAYRFVKEGLSKGVLSQVTATENLSDKYMDLSEMPSCRNLQEGSRSIESGNSITDKALFIDYLMTNYSYYGNSLKHDGMQYEVEYLIAGDESDVEALGAVVTDLLLARETANYFTICNNNSLSSQADAIARILAGFTMNEGIIQAVKYAIMGAWAYIESLLDVRLLLYGGKVAAVKNAEDWTSDVYHLSSCFDVNFRAKPSEKGLSYKDYLIGFLMLNANGVLSMRACDIMEDALHNTDDYVNTRLDNMAFAADITIDYSANPMFLSLFSEQKESGGYWIKKTKSISY